MQATALDDLGQGSRGAAADQQDRRGDEEKRRGEQPAALGELELHHRLAGWYDHHWSQWRPASIAVLGVTPNGSRAKALSTVSWLTGTPLAVVNQLPRTRSLWPVGPSPLTTTGAA